MRNCRIATVLLGLFVLAGCVPRARSFSRTHLYQRSLYDAYRGEGTATITGQAFAKTRGGDVKVAAGEIVYLIPGTAYESEQAKFEHDFASAIEAGFVSITPAFASEALEFRREARADAEGRFRFDRIPAGKWLVECEIFWEVPGRLGLEKTGGLGLVVVEVVEGETKEVLVTP